MVTIKSSFEIGHLQCDMMKKSDNPFDKNIEFET